MSFRLKTILGIALIEIFVLGILVATSLHDLRTSNERELQTRAHTTAQLLATMTSDAVVSLDLATLDALVDQTLANKGLLFVRIRNDDGLILSEGGATPSQVAQPGDKGDPGNGFQVTAPIEISGAPFGSVEIGLSTALLNDVVAAGTKRMLMIAGAEVFLVAVFGFVLGTILTRQLAGLRDGAARVANGEFGHHMPVVGKDELACTARSFNTMSTALAEFARVTKIEKDRAEAGRVFAETLLHNAINSVSQAIFIVDENGLLRFVNRSARELYRLEGQRDLSECRFEDVIGEAYRAASAGDADVESGPLEDRLNRLESRTVQTWQSTWRDGRVLLHTQRPISAGGFVMVDTDVTDLFEANERNRRLELELVETHKLESLGTLASGVAHEINTPTQFIGDNLTFLRESFADVMAFVDTIAEGAEEAAKEGLEDIDWTFLKEEIPSALSEAADGVASIGKIVRSIKEFAHPDDSEATVTDMAKLIENAATVSRSQWRHSADLVLEPVTSEVMVPCYPGDVSQVVINLIVNAADAIADHAKEHDYPTGKGTISIGVTADASNCVITVQDDGPGIPKEAARRVFDMFYTTKPPGKGTGQGLAICKSIVEMKHRGKLSVQSEPGKGSLFKVVLPIPDQAAEMDELPPKAA